MQVFVWNSGYETRIPLIDEQHRRLVEMINAMASCKMETPQDLLDLDHLFDQLFDYARLHFSEEESLLKRFNIVSAHSEKHYKEHADFILMMNGLKKSHQNLQIEGFDLLHRYLVSWLGFHILGTDQSLARQIKYIENHSSPEEAFDQDKKHHGQGIAILQNALYRLYEVVSEQNLFLQQNNIQLEQEVTRQTRELREANLQLQEEQIELRTLNEQLQHAQTQVLQSEKMAAIGQLAAGVAHEINNPVGYVNSNLGTLKTYIDRLLQVLAAYAELEKRIPQDEAYATLQAIKEAAELDYLQQDIVDLIKESREGLERVTRIVHDLKDFSHVDSAEWLEADLNKGLDSTLNVIWNEVKYKARVVKDYGAIPLLYCIASQINQVFMNLIVNASHAIEDNGVITLRTRLESDQIMIEIADTGTGIPLEIQQRIFEPFFTTKPVGKGTGLGLSLSYDIVKKHGGRFDVSSEPGVGTSFKIWLPLHLREPGT